MIKQIIFCTIGSTFFAISMKVPKNCIYLAFIGSLITASIERMMYAITSDNVKFMHYAKSTILTGLGISLGAVIATITVKLLEKKRLPK